MSPIRYKLQIDLLKDLQPARIIGKQWKVPFGLEFIA